MLIVVVVCPARGSFSFRPSIPQRLPCRKSPTKNVVATYHAGTSTFGGRDTRILSRQLGLANTMHLQLALRQAIKKHLDLTSKGMLSVYWVLQQAYLARVCSCLKNTLLIFPVFLVGGNLVRMPC
eukprot:525641-Pleurochrysis_carterae.AAC.1